MKFAVILLAILGIAAAKTLEEQIDNAIELITQNDAHVSVDECTTKCDIIFDNKHDEGVSDRLCHQKCQCAIKNTHCEAPPQPTDHTHEPGYTFHSHTDTPPTQESLV